MTSPRAFNLTDAERRRAERVDELAALGGEAAVGELIAMMSDASWTVRRAVVAALAALGDETAEPLAAWLREQRTSEHAIAATVDALAAASGEGATRAVIPLLDHPVPAVAADAAAILGRRRANEATAALTRALSHDDDNVAVGAIEALGAIGGTRSVDALIALLAQKNFFRTFPALQVLARVGDPRVVGPIAELLSDDAYRLEAARALGRTGFAQAVRPLASLLPGAVDAVVRLVALALADLLERAEWTGAAEHAIETMQLVIGPELPRFVAALRRADVAERAAIATVLGRIGDATAIPELARLLDDADVRAAATDAIQRVTRTHDDALHVALATGEPATRVAVLPVVRAASAAADVRAMLRDEDSETRARACEALARIGDTSAVGDLFTALGDASPRVAHAATAAIHSLGTADTAARTIAALRTGTSAVRRHALRIVAYMGFDAAFDAVAALVADPDVRLAELAVAALAPLTDPRAEAALATLARDPRDGVRAAAMRAAGQRGGDAALAQLETGLTDGAPWVRYYACQGLGRLGEGDSAAVARVIACLADPAPFVRIAAIEALGHASGSAAWAALAAAAQSTDPDELRAALVSIALRPRAEALPYLLAGAAAADPATQLIALQGLARRTEPEALAALAAAARRAEPEVRDAALSLLGERTDAGAAAVLVEVALVSAEDHPSQLALSRAGGARIAAIQAHLGTAEAGDAAAARLVGALARMRDTAATAALHAALVKGGPAVRRAVAAALVAITDRDARDDLARLAATDPDLEVRRIAAAASAD